MKLNLMVLFLFLFVASSQLTAQDAGLPEGYPETPRKITCMNAGWRFHLGDAKGAFYGIDFDDSQWVTINVPHTLKLTSLALDGCQDDSTQPTFHRNVGWYRRFIDVDGSANKKVFLEFEGAHQVTDAWVNGKHVGQHAIGGYTPFHFDITTYVTPGKANQVTLLVDNRRRDDIPPDPGPFDYIKFSGLYRDVYLVETDRIHITFPWEERFAGVLITTPSVDPLNGTATIDIKTVVRNEQDKTQKCSVLTRIIDKDGFVVLRMNNSATVVPASDKLFSQCGGIEENLHLWSCDDPYLYRVNTTVFCEGIPVDCLENPLGIRKLELNRHDGLLLNGKPIEIIGVNRHQHYPYIGDAVPNSLHFKDILQLKELGMNTIRTAHYTQDNALINACDQLGMLVYEEAPSWINLGDEKWFANLEEAARRMVRNHRNHPSIVVWGGGINHRGTVPRLHYAIKEEDPVRWTASNNSEWAGFQGSGICDLYSNMDYAGVPDWTEKEYLLAMEGGRGPRVISKYKADPLRLGMLSWTAHAYYNFRPRKPEYPDDRMSYGIMDGFRVPRPSPNSVKWYQSEMASNPLVIIDDDWKESIEKLTVYSNCHEVELFVNGVSIGRRKPDNDPELVNLNHPPYTFPITRFEPGELAAKGYIDGRVVANASVRTPEEAKAIRLVVDLKGRELVADGSDIVMTYAYIVDKNGTILYDSEYDVTFSVAGPASIVGEGADIGSNPKKSRRGHSPAMIRAGLKAGQIVLKAEAEGLKSSTVKFESVPYDDDVIAASAKPIYDMERIRIDLGADGQNIQYGWTPWYGKDNEVAIKDFSELDGFTATLRYGSNKGTSRWTDDLNLKVWHGYMLADGACVIDPDGLELELSGLKAGLYRIKTYHQKPHTNVLRDDPNSRRIKNLGLDDIPSALALKVTVSDAGLRGRPKSITATVSREEEANVSGPGFSEFDIRSDGKNSVVISIKGADGNDGVWLSGFELREMPGNQ